MTAETTQGNVQEPAKESSKEINFRRLEERYERQLAQERAAREEAEKRYQEINSKKPPEDDDDDDEPYIDKKRLAKKMSSFELKLEEKIERKAEEKARQLLQQEKRESWMRSNPDFYDVMQNAEKFANHDPELAETILAMPESFERQKLVYKNIKALGLHQEPKKEPSIQEKIDANKKTPYYQPSGMGTAPYGNRGDFSATGQKNAYDQMQELKRRLRLG
jgi:actin-related protein